MKLTDRFRDEIEYNDTLFILNLSFDIVLRAYELLGDDQFSKIEKVPILFEMIVINHDEIPLTFEEKNKIVKAIFNEYLNSKDKSSGGSSKKLYDLSADAHYIYASFLQDYRLDLFDLQGKLHWSKFLALLGGLSETTKFKEVVGIRQQKVPNPTKHNQDERKRIIQLKQIYRLEGDKPSMEEADNIMSAYSASLKKAAKVGGNSG